MTFQIGDRVQEGKWQRLTGTAVRIPTASIPYVRADYEKMRESCESPTIVFTDGYNFL